MNSCDGSTVVGYLRRTLCVGAPADTPDEELVGRFVAQRDEAAFAALLRRHGPMVWGVCQRLLAHQQDAEDAFQATFVVLACKAASIGQRKLLANWLFGVARRAALSVRAARSRRARREQPCGDPASVAAPTETPWDDVRDVLDEELSRMPVKYRLPLLLCCLEGMTHAQAGEYLGWPTGTVAGRLSRGREMLRTRLLRRGVMVPAAALAAALTPCAASSAIPPQLIALSIRNAAAVAATGKLAAAVASPTVATVIRGMLTKMFVSRLLATTVVLGSLAVTLGSAGATWYLTHLSGPLPPVVEAPARKGSYAANVPHPKPPSGEAGERSTGKPALKLPHDPNTVVLQMDRSLESATGSGMILRIFADGRVNAEVPDGLASLAAADLTKHEKDRAGVADSGREPPKIKQFTGRLSAQELEDLLRFALHDQEFFDFDPARVKDTIRDQYQSDANVVDATDATITHFRIQTADRSHEVSWTRLSKTAWDFPDVERLLQLHALDRRLQQAFYVLLAGGSEWVERAVQKANELAQPLYLRYPELPRLTAEDLFALTPSGDATAMVWTFSRNRDKKVRNPLFEVSINIPREGEPTLRYVIPPQSTTLRSSGGVTK